MAYLINKIGTGFPFKERTNEDIMAEHPEWSAQKIFDKVGVKRRMICEEEESSLSNSIKAFEDLVNKLDSVPKIDLVLYVSNSSVNQAPGDGHLFIKSFKELRGAGCIDINLGCSGYTYALGVASGLVNTHKSQKNILIITSDQYSKYIDDSDKGNKTIFGDASTASIVSNKLNSIKDEAWIIEDFVCGANGEHYIDLNITTPKGSDKKLFMNGQGIFAFTANEVVNFIKDQNIDFSDLKVVFHQANAYMLDYMRKKLGINKENFILSFQNYGNTVSSSIPLVLVDHCNTLKSSNLFLCGFGIGASYSSIKLSPK